jgi:hypothetical protein
MNSTIKESLVFNNNPPGKPTKRTTKKKNDGETVYKQILIDAKLKTGQTGQKMELTRQSPLRTERTTLNFSDI